MNIHTNIKQKNIKEPTTFVEATLLLAECYQKAVDAAIMEEDDKVRLWVDASRPLKTYIKKYRKLDQDNLIADLEESGSKKELNAALNILKASEPFIIAWANRFTELKLEKFENFKSIHWDIFLDYIVPLTWNWNNDLFVLMNKDQTIFKKLVKRGHQRFIIIEEDENKRKEILELISNLGIKKDAFVTKSSEMIPNLISTWVTDPPQFSRVIAAQDCEDKKVHEDGLKSVHELVHEGMINAITFDTTIKSHDFTWIKNGLGSLNDLIEHPHAAALNDKFSGHSAVIVSPGPSLEKNIEELAKVNDRAVIIAGSHSLQYLRDKNIIPHVILHVDPNISIEGYFKDFELEKVELLILSATTAPDLLKLPVKRKTYIYANAYFDHWIMRILGYEDFTLYGSCVSIAAFKLAVLWGCSEIALVGQDLSFADGKYYAGKTKAPDLVMKTFTDAEKEKIHKIPGYYGGEVFTKNDYRIYHQQFQETAKGISETKKIKLFNATEGGAFIEGFKNISLADFIAKNLTRKNLKVWSDVSLEKILINKTQKHKVRGYLIKEKKYLDETEKLLMSAMKKVLDNSVSMDGLQKKIARKLKKSMIVKIAIQDEVQKVSDREKYSNDEQGFRRRGYDMYAACLSVILDLKKALLKIKV